MKSTPSWTQIVENSTVPLPESMVQAELDNSVAQLRIAAFRHEEQDDIEASFWPGTGPRVSSRGVAAGRGEEPEEATPSRQDIEPKRSRRPTKRSKQKSPSQAERNNIELEQRATTSRRTISWIIQAGPNRRSSTHFSVKHRQEGQEDSISWTHGGESLNSGQDFSRGHSRMNEQMNTLVPISRADRRRRAILRHLLSAPERPNCLPRRRSTT